MCAHVRAHTCVLDAGWAKLHSHCLDHEDPGKGKGNVKGLAGRDTQRLFSSPKEDFGQAGSLEFRGMSAPGEKPSLIGQIPAPLLTQSHKLTSDTPDRLSEAGNRSSAPLLSQRAAGTGGGGSQLSVSLSLK